MSVMPVIAGASGFIAYRCGQASACVRNVRCAAHGAFVSSRAASIKAIFSVSVHADPLTVVSSGTLSRVAVYAMYSASVQKLLLEAPPGVATIVIPGIYRFRAWV